ncbi:MAG TPA: NAD(+)/NADH kinase [Thermoanaerobaculia bacterium]|nr:NAD(+)/NADH kinase [Thermoanaerobaculia bacterium]
MKTARKSRRIRRVGLVTRYSSADALGLSRTLARALRRRGLTVVHDAESMAARGEPGGVPRSAIARAVDLVVTLGGDGTLLSVARHPAPGVPVLGVDIGGTLGFLTACHPGEFPRLLEAALAGEAAVEPRRLLAVTVTETGRPPRRYRVVNDAVVSRTALARIATIRVAADGAIVSRFRGDGVIVSTPTGSTGYNLSTGGPILEPRMPAITLTPICPHTLTLRPLVLPDSVRLELAVEGDPSEVYLTLDGQEGFPVSSAMKIAIAKAPIAVGLVRHSKDSFYDVLAGKLSFGGGHRKGSR